MIKNNLIFTQGKALFIAGVLTTVIGYYIHTSIAIIGLLFTLFGLYFFRNPHRALTGDDDDVLVSPADGKVVDIQCHTDGRFDGFDQKISIFLSPFDVHVNRVPMSGLIADICYKSGKFTLAFTPKSSDLNERNDIVIVNGPKKILVRQIAGTIARKIVWWVKAGDVVSTGQKYGMIKFGSRVDLFFPQEVVLSVKLGERVYGGITVIGNWHNI